MHYNWIIRQEAMDGHCDRAEALLNGFFEDPRAARPDVSSFNALLEGLVSSLNPGGQRGGVQGGGEAVFEGRALGVVVEAAILAEASLLSWTDLAQ